MTPEPLADEPQEDESRAMRLFHKVFGYGSDNPGGNGRLEFAGWGLVLLPVIVPIAGLFDTSTPSGFGWPVVPLMVLGVFFVRAAKKPPSDDV